MDSSKQSPLSTYLLFSLLISQIVLLLLLFIKIDKLIAISNITQPELPAYIPDVSPDDDPSKGSENAPVTIILFSDYQCPFCAQANSQLDNLLSEYHDQIRVVYRDYPLISHQFAFRAAEAANCAREQGKFFEMHNLLFLNQATLGEPEVLSSLANTLELDMEMFNACMESHKYQSEVQHDVEDGQFYQVFSTPTFFVDGYRVEGGDIENIKRLIDQALNE